MHGYNEDELGAILPLFLWMDGGVCVGGVQHSVPDLKKNCPSK